MGSKISCYTCEHYRPIDPDKGLCNILEDLAGDSFYVNRSSNECIYNLTKLPKQLTNAQTTSRDERAETKKREFWEHAQRCAEEVKLWPEWKRRKAYGQ